MYICNAYNIHIKYDLFVYVILIHEPCSVLFFVYVIPVSTKKVALEEKFYRITLIIAQFICLILFVTDLVMQNHYTSIYLEFRGYLFEVDE